MTEILLMGFMLFMIWYIFKMKVVNGYVYAKFPVAHKNGFGSLANPKDIKRGYRWTNAFDLLKKFKKSDKNRVFMDYFRFDEEYKREARLSSFFAKKAENTPLYFDPLKMTQGVLLVGKMGSGKTELYMSILKQKFYNRAIIHQVKAGDFSSVFLRKRDILFSPYDDRGYLWDIMEENEGIIKTFFENYANSIMGDKKDFFSATANRLYNELAQKIRTKHQNETSAKKWMYFIKAIKDLFNEMDSGSQNSKKDVKGTMEAIIEPLEIMAWKMQNPKQKRFLIKDFFAMKNQTKLILDNIPEYEKSLTPLFTAFMACVSQVHTSMPDTKTDFTLYALDEYLSMASIMDEASKKRLHTLIRSKGGILMPAVQYIPKDDKKMQQLLTSSAYAWIYFSVIDDETIDLFKKTVGEVEYSYEEKNRNGKGDKNYSTKDKKDFLIYNELINGLGEKFEHLVYLPNHKYLYKGYTPQVQLKQIAAKQVPVDLSPFYAMKYSADEEEQDLKNLTFEDLFKQKPLSKIEEFRLFKKFQNAKNSGNEEAIKNFKKENGLEVVNLKFLFKKYMEDQQVIKSKMKMFDTSERFRLFQEFQELKGNDEKELEFIEKHELFGALPSFFKFDSVNADVLEDEL
jgi:hypothetical protein